MLLVNLSHHAKLKTMARIKFSSLVNDIRGSVGGVTFSRNANGAYTRNRTKGTNRKSVGQLAVRALFTGLSSAYRNLDTQDMQTFIDQAKNYPYKNKVGISSQYTGNQLYMKLNSTLHQSGLPMISVCTAPVSIVPTIQCAVTASQGDALFVIGNYKFLNSGIVPVGQAVAVYATAMLSPGIMQAGAPAYRKIYVAAAGYDFNTVPNNLLLQTAYENVFGSAWSSLPKYVGQQIFFKFKDISTANGQSGKSDFTAAAVIAI